LSVAIEEIGQCKILTFSIDRQIDREARES
jgi:hypothetical protein